MIFRILPNLEENVTYKKLFIDPKNHHRLSEKNKENFWSKTSNVLQSFSGYLTDIRIFNRGFSIPVCIAELLESNSLLKEKNYVDWLSTVSISLYQPLETIAFLFDHNWIFPDRKSNNCLWWYAVSTRFWFLWVILELSKLSHKILRSCGKGIENLEFVGLIEHLATLPLCVHWSLEEGCLDPIYVGFFGTIAGGLSTAFMWKDVWAHLLKELRMVS
ncbi:hypothetical protein CANINC_003879 [Pichia inconspicua]|uniref:Uncharacterized protein n=1 Tax=Pichia inconspicua TaxID=52247 RepID=A0A4T0WY02_9ASCO|nr:hypothetical protein CANINC_003879 [[Candida] inconspicua]